MSKQAACKAKFIWQVITAAHRQLGTNVNGEVRASMLQRVNVVHSWWGGCLVPSVSFASPHEKLIVTFDKTRMRKLPDNLRLNRSEPPIIRVRTKLEYIKINRTPEEIAARKKAENEQRRTGEVPA